MSDISWFCKFLGFYFCSLILGVLNIGSVGSVLKLIAFVPIVIWFFNGGFIKNSPFTKSFSFFFLISFFSSLWSINQDSSVSRLISLAGFLLLVFAISSHTYSSIELQFLKVCLIWSSRITLVIAFLFSSKYGGRLFLSGIINEDPNYLCCYFVFGIISNMEIFLSDNNWKKKILNVIEFSMYLYIVIATGSRGGGGAILFAIVTFILFFKSRNSEIVIISMKKIVFFILFFICLFIVQSWVSTEVLNRFSSEAIIESNGTGRYDIWNAAIHAFADSDLFRKMIGYGPATARDITYIFSFPSHNVIHNIFIENLLELGLFGLISYLLYIGSFILMARKMNSIFSFSVIMGICFLSLSTSLYAFKPYWNIMLFIECLYFRQELVRFK